MGIRARADFQGKTLLPWVASDGAPDGAALIPGALRTRRWKALMRGGWEAALFDLEADPRETTDLSSTRPEIVQELRTRYASVTSHSQKLAKRLRAGAGPPATNGTIVAVSPEERERLKALGYFLD